MYVRMHLQGCFTIIALIYMLEYNLSATNPLFHLYIG